MNRYDDDEIRSVTLEDGKLINEDEWPWHRNEAFDQGLICLIDEHGESYTRDDILSLIQVYLTKVNLPETYQVEGLGEKTLETMARKVYAHCANFHTLPATLLDEEIRDCCVFGEAHEYLRGFYGSCIICKHTVNLDEQVEFLHDTMVIRDQCYDLSEGLPDFAHTSCLKKKGIQL